MTDKLREAIAEQISEGLGATLRKFCDSPEAKQARYYLHAMPKSDWNTLIGMLAEESAGAARAALAAAPQPAPETDWGPDVGKEVLPPYQPAPDREALVEAMADRATLAREIAKAMIGRAPGNGMILAIADALLARGLRLPEAGNPVSDASETSNVQNTHIALLDTQIAAQDCIIKRLEAERDALQGQLNDLRNGWANSVKAHAALLAERDAAFAAGQEEMRERAAKAANATANVTGTGPQRRIVDALDVWSAIHALPINPRP